MDPKHLEPRQIALIASRGRCVIGVVCMLCPGLVARVLFGRSDGSLKALARMTGVRDLVLGVGALTALKEQQHDAEWLSMGAACDGFDAVVCIASPGLPKRTRLIGVGAGAMSGYLMRLSREFAADRERSVDENPASPFG
jgi:hypothetical protein